MKKKYLINNIGIGDLIFFCGLIRSTHKIGDSIEFYLSKETLKLYRENSEQYEKFCYEYLKFFLEGYNLKILNSQSETNFVFTDDYKKNKKVVNDTNVREHIKNKLNQIETQFKNENYLVVFTKVRDLHYNNFTSISNELSNRFNNFGGKIILLGEKEIKYTTEYAIHGKDLIYSIYDFCIKNIDNEKLIDLTKTVYEFSDFSLDGILKDISIISNSKEVYIFGGGGFFCLSLFTNKLTSLTNTTYYNAFYSENNQKIFNNIDKFKEYLKS